MRVLKYFTVGLFVLLMFFGCDDLILTHPLTKNGDKENFLDKRLLGDWYYIKHEDGKEDEKIIYRVRYRDKNHLELSKASYLNNNNLLVTSKINNQTYLSKEEDGNYKIYKYKIENDSLHIYYYSNDNAKIIDNSNRNVKNNFSKILKKYEEKYWGSLKKIE
ncbi:MAG: hypothetical protein GXO60_04650 [Epsilonproteobacteria bacterium]|nr:hypothetical protein [Campylobacterota bacterium]